MEIKNRGITGKLKNKGLIHRIAVVLFWLVVWHLASVAVGHHLLLVSPVEVAKTLIFLIGDFSFWSTVAFSFVRIVSGFLLAIVAGIFFAAISAKSTVIRALLTPFFLVVKSVPVVSFIILVLIWAGSDILAVIISFLMVLPIIYTNVLEGIDRTDPRLLEMAGVFYIPRINVLKYIYINSCMPYFISASKVGLGLCWKSGIAAEVIGLPDGSIGEKLYQSKIFLSTGELFSWTIVIIAVSFLFEKLFIRALKSFENSLKQ